MEEYNHGGIEERKSKVLDWFKDKNNRILIGILIFAFAIRLYYFIMTKSQPLWWDELCYGCFSES